MDSSPPNATGSHCSSKTCVNYVTEALAAAAWGTGDGGQRQQANSPQANRFLQSHPTTIFCRARNVAAPASPSSGEVFQDVAPGTSLSSFYGGRFFRGWAYRHQSTL